MSTGSQKVNIYLKKILPQQEMVDNFLEYLVAMNKDAVKLLYPSQGFFYGNAMTPSGVDEVTLQTPSLATDGLANILKLDPSNAKVKFENTLNDVYQVGLRYNILERNTEINVRTGKIEYSYFEDAIGEKGEPDLVVDNGSTLTLIVDGVTEVGVSNAGRNAIIYLKSPIGQADAFYEGLVQFIGGKNVVNTTHLLGQTAGLVSTDPSDYVVFIVGATVRKNVNLLADPNIAFAGTLTGNGAGNIPNTGDIDTSASTQLFSGGISTPIMASIRSKLTGGGLVSWDLKNQTLSWSENFKFVIASKTFDFTINAGNITAIADGEAIYFQRDEVGGVKTFSKALLSAIPFDPIYELIALRLGDSIYFKEQMTLKGISGAIVSSRIDGLLASDDYIYTVRAIDFNTTVLPSGATVIIDDITLVNGDRVLFASDILNGIYSVDNIGSAATWTKVKAFAGTDIPKDMSLVKVQEGSEEFIKTIYQYTSSKKWRPIDSSEIATEPTGLYDKDQVSFSFDELSRIFTVEPVGDYFFYAEKGKIFKVEGPKTYEVPDLQGLHYIHFDNGILTSTQVFSIDQILRKTWVSTIYWDVTNKKAIFLGDSRHMLIMDSTTHGYLRFTQGCKYSYGLGINAITSGDGSLDSHAQAAIDDGQIFQQDLIIDIKNNAAPSEFFEQILSPIGNFPIYKRIGASGEWQKEAATNFPLKAGTLRPQINKFDAGVWSTVDASANGYFIAMYLVASYDVREPIIAVMGQREDTTLANAQENNTLSSLLVGDLPTLEIKPIYRLIFQVSSTYSNTIKAKLVDITDLKHIEDSANNGFSPADHNALNGRNQSGAHTSSAISTSPTDFFGAMDEEDSDLKKSLKTLDDHFKALRILPHPTNKKRVIVTAASVTLSNGIILEQQIKNLIIKSDQLEIDFSTGIIYQSDGVTQFNSGANNFTPVVPPVGQNRWAALTMLSSTINSDNTINMIPVLLFSASSDYRAAFGGGLKLGQIKLINSGSGIDDIEKDNITRQGVGGGGAGGGNSDNVAMIYTTGFTVDSNDDETQKLHLLSSNGVSGFPVNLPLTFSGGAIITSMLNKTFAFKNYYTDGVQAAILINRQSGDIDIEKYGASCTIEEGETFRMKIVKTGSGVTVSDYKWIFV